MVLSFIALMPLPFSPFFPFPFLRVDASPLLPFFPFPLSSCSLFFSLCISHRRSTSSRRHDTGPRPRRPGQGRRCPHGFDRRLGRQRQPRAATTARPLPGQQARPAPPAPGHDGPTTTITTAHAPPATATTTKDGPSSPRRRRRRAQAAPRPRPQAQHECVARRVDDARLKGIVRPVPGGFGR